MDLALKLFRLKHTHIEDDFRFSDLSDLSEEGGNEVLRHRRIQIAHIPAHQPSIIIRSTYSRMQMCENPTMFAASHWARAARIQRFVLPPQRWHRVKLWRVNIMANQMVAWIVAGIVLAAIRSAGAIRAAVAVGARSVAIVRVLKTMIRADNSESGFRAREIGVLAERPTFISISFRTPFFAIRNAAQNLE